MPEAAVHLAVALDGAGWHPESRREQSPRRDLLDAGYWADLASEAEAGLLDFLTIEDSFGPRPQLARDAPADAGGRLDAVLLAARIAPLTRHIGLIPSVITTHTEPFHVSTAIATLDYVSEGRAGWRPLASVSAADARLFGRREFPEFTREDRRETGIRQHIADRFEEAADHVEVVRRLWDSWEDDAVIRDVATGRFIDRDKLHYIDFEGTWFSVRGPSITPRPPQGQPVIAALAHSEGPRRFAARTADIVFVTPRDAADAAEIVTDIRAMEASSGRLARAASDGEGRVHGGREAGGGRQPLQIYADLNVFIDEAPGAAAARRARLDDAAGTPYASDAAIADGTPAAIADLLLEWRAAGLDGFRLRPGTLPHDLEGITRGLVPELRRRGVFRDSYAEGTLRERLGLPRPVNRYEATERAAPSLPAAPAGGEHVVPFPRQAGAS